MSRDRPDDPAGSGQPSRTTPPEADREAADRWQVVSVSLHGDPPAHGQAQAVGGASPDGGHALPPEGSQALPPGGGVFSVEGRPAPGLYWLAWILGVAGVGGFGVAILAGTQNAALASLLFLGSLGTLALGLAVACGYQVLARAGRPAAGYRGPSPFLVFGVIFAVSNLIAGVFVLLGFRDATEPAVFLATVGVIATLYLIAVLLLVVRTGALDWRSMGWPGRGYSGVRFLGDAGFGIAVTLPAVFAILVLAALVGSVLDVRAPSVLPSPGTSLEAIAVVLAAVLIAPVGEELFFRGFALSAWQREIGPRSALLRSSLFFAVVHILNISTTTFTEGAKQALLQFVVILPLALLLGALFQSRGMIAAIAAHVTYNGTLLLLAFFAARFVTPA